MSKETPVQIAGVPADCTLESAGEWALKRVGKKRADHVVGVRKVGRKIARLAGLDRESQFIVELACVLHDACKETKDVDLVRQAAEGGLAPDAVERANGHLLHGPVAALVVRETLGITNEAVLDAVTQHTLGANPMTDTAKIVFLADCLEESRPKSYTRPIWKALLGEASEEAEATDKDGHVEGHVDLDRAMLVALDLGLAQLLESRRAIHPKTVDVRNYFLGIVKASESRIV